MYREAQQDDGTRNYAAAKSHAFMHRTLMGAALGFEWQTDGCPTLRQPMSNNKDRSCHDTSESTLQSCKWPRAKPGQQLAAVQHGGKGACTAAWRRETRCLPASDTQAAGLHHAPQQNEASSAAAWRRKPGAGIQLHPSAKRAGRALLPGGAHTPLPRGARVLLACTMHPSLIGPGECPLLSKMRQLHASQDARE